MQLHRCNCTAQDHTHRNKNHRIQSKCTRTHNQRAILLHLEQANKKETINVCHRLVEMPIGLIGRLFIARLWLLWPTSINQFTMGTSVGACALSSCIGKNPLMSVLSALLICVLSDFLLLRYWIFIMVSLEFCVITFIFQYVKAAFPNSDLAFKTR